MFPCFLRVLVGTSRNLLRSKSKQNSNVLRSDFYATNCSIMAQRSITSFFKITPPKRDDEKQKVAVKVEENDSEEQNGITDERKGDLSPITNGREKRMSKRARLESSDSDSGALNTSKASPSASSEKKKKPKRQRIESSGSESEAVPQTASPTSSGKSSPQSESQNENKIKVKVEKSDSPKTYASPKNKKGQTKPQKEVKKSPKLLKSQNQESSKSDEDSPKTPSKKNSPERNPSPKSIKKVKKEVISDGSNSDMKENILNKSVSNDSDDICFDVTPVPETDYNPAKLKYHPIKDACWLHGKPVPYLALAKTFEAIEPVSARLKIIEILSNYFRSVIVLTPEDLLPSVYLCLNQLAPAYHSLELGIAETYLMKAVGACTGRTLAQVRAAARGPGGLGAAAEEARAHQRTMFPQPPLQLRRVFAALKEVARMTGQSSVNKKIAKIQSLYIASRQCEARFLVRSLEGKLRIGLAEQSALQALALAAARSPPGAARLDAARGMAPDAFKARVDQHALLIKTTYCECPNYELVIPALLAHGAEALPEHCRLAPGVPLKPMLAHPTRGVHEVFNRFEGCSFTCEWKYDGERAQIHVPSDDAGARLDRAAVFSRNQENNTSKYPDVVRRLGALLRPAVRDCVLDCEAVAYDTRSKQILPFQVLSTRKRKDAVEGDIKVQVCVFAFDLLYLNGRALVRRPLRERRALLREHFNEVPGEWQFATSKDCSSMEEVQAFLEESVKGSCEGLMVKTLEGPAAHYDIARRSRNWLKLKKDYLEGVGDTLDVVIIGAYHGRGRRSATYGGFLAACRDPDSDTYQTLCKLGTGFSDEDLQKLTETLKQHEIPHPKSYYSYDRALEPDAWVEAACVWEVRCADLSLSPAHRAAIGRVDPDKGISLRFPRFVRVREDKTPESATSAQQVAELYLAQDQVRNGAAAAALHADDFY